MQRIVYILFILLTCHAGVAAGRQLTMGKPDDSVADISSKVLTEAYGRIGIRVDFRELPAERSLVQSDQGALDGDVNRIRGIEKDYPNLVMVPVPVNTMEQTVFSAKHDFPVNGWESLKPYRIAIRLGTKVVEHNTRGMDVTAFPSYDKVFTLVALGRYDVAVAASVTGWFYIKKHNLTTVKKLSPALATLHLYHYIHRKNADLLPRITAALEAMQQDGRIQTIRDRFTTELSP